jgi:hypothetical protein
MEGTLHKSGSPEKLLPILHSAWQHFSFFINKLGPLAISKSNSDGSKFDSGDKTTELFKVNSNGATTPSPHPHPPDHDKRKINLGGGISGAV